MTNRPAWIRRSVLLGNRLSNGELASDPHALSLVNNENAERGLRRTHSRRAGCQARATLLVLAGSIWPRLAQSGCTARPGWLNLAVLVAPGHPSWLDLAALVALGRAGWLNLVALGALARPGWLDLAALRTLACPDLPNLPALSSLARPARPDPSSNEGPNA